MKNDAKSENVENDCITNFFDKCRLISDSEMQALWSRVLSGEVNSPCSFTKRTVNTLSSIDKWDAELFTQLCKFGWGSKREPLIFDYEDDIYSKHGINFITLSHLEDIGLIQFNYLSAYMSNGLSKKINFS